MVATTVTVINPAIKLITIVGPTASGKSALALDLAERFGGEIVCADSRTIYRGLDIGTAKPTAADQARLAHHLLDIAEPGQTVSVAEFKRLAEAAINDIASRGKVPFLVGGSGLYIDAVLFDYQAATRRNSGRGLASGNQVITKGFTVKTYFDEARWSSVVKEPDWYVQLADELAGLKQQSQNNNNPELQAIKLQVRSFFEEKLLSGAIALASEGENLDKQRRPIDTVVIHHTSSDPGYNVARMNAVHLLNIYMPYYLAPHVPGEEHLLGQPIWSNHFDEAGKQVFYAYHWFVAMDGSVRRLLTDEAIGWQAGNWDINTRSVGICLDNDYSQADPPSAVLDAVAGIIRQHYRLVPIQNIIGHRDCYPKTVCPGNTFESSWKYILRSHVSRKAR